MKKKKVLTITVSMLALSASLAFADKADAAKNMHRLYNPNSGEHFYTADNNEKNVLVNKHKWRYEGIGWTAPDSGADVYRLYNPNSGEHHYTMGANERNHLVKVGWKYEGVGWKSDNFKGQALHRLYNPNAGAGSHHYTKDTNERNHLARVGWKKEGIGWYGINPNQKISIKIVHKGSDGKTLNQSTAQVKRDTNYTAKSKTFNGYTLKGAKSQTVKADNNKTVTFNYTKNAVKPTPVTKYNVTVKHVGSDNKTLKSSSVSVEKGKSYTAKAESFTGYTLKGNNSQTVTVNSNKTITFNYTKNPTPAAKHTVTIKHVGSDGKILSNNTVTVDKGKTYTANAAAFVGYTLNGNKTQTVTVNSDTTITFNYTKDVTPPTPVTKYKVTVNSLCAGQIIKTKTETVDKGTKYTAFAEDIEGYDLNEYNVKTVTVNSDTVITFDYKKIELVDTFNLKIYVDDVYYTTIVKTIKQGESYQPATKNLGLDENKYDLSNGVTYSTKNWIGGQTYDYEFDVYTFKTLSDAEIAKLKSTIITKVNELRAQSGVAPVTEATLLSNAAKVRARELNTVFDHVRPNRTGYFTAIDEVGIPYGDSGENIASKSTNERDGAKLGLQLYNQWLGSPGHKATMQSARFTKIGIGVYVVRNEVYATQLFID
ncbi:hypothetical protein IGI52_002497 [Enterococcus sp. DIV0187]